MDVQRKPERLDVVLDHFKLLLVAENGLGVLHGQESTDLLALLLLVEDYLFEQNNVLVHHDYERLEGLVGLEEGFHTLEKLP